MLIFVYGTMMKKGEAHELLSRANFVSEASLAGSLYDIGGGEFPAVTLEGRYRIDGELYDVPETALPEIDAYEGYNPAEPEDSLFIRREVTVHLPNRKTEKAQAYIMDPGMLDIFIAEPLSRTRWL